MKINSFGIVLSSIIALAKAKQYTFNVVSILGEGSSLGVKYGETVKPLTPSLFPLFTGTVEADDIKEYHYVSLDSNNQVIEEETIKRTYSEETSKINEVFNRTNKNVVVNDLPRPFKGMFNMGTKSFKPLPKNTIYNIYARCNETEYRDLVDTPFKDKKINTNKATCEISIISPDSKFKSDGTFHVIGYGSRKFKKLSFTMKFDKKFLGRKAIKLRGMANDDSLLREPLTTELFKAVGVPVQEGTFARLFINEEVFGLYSMVDSFNDRWLGAYVHGNEKAKIGFNYKLYSTPPIGPYATLRYEGEEVEAYNDGTYVLDEYEKKDIPKEDKKTQWARLIQFTKLYENWVNTYGNDQSEKAIEELKKFLNVESLIRLMVGETLVMALDNFWIALSNASLYYNPERDNYQFIPYDFDEALFGPKSSELLDRVGSLQDCLHWADSDINPVDHYFTNNLMSHPQIKERFDVVLAITTKEVFNKEVTSAYIHSLVDLIGEDVEWSFDLVEQLHNAYNGRVEHFTIQQFQDNIDYDKTNYDKAQRLTENTFGVSEYIDLRGDSCKAYSANVDTSKNINISDDYDISEKIEDDKLEKSGAISTKNLSLFLVLVHVVLLLL